MSWIAINIFSIFEFFLSFFHFFLRTKISYAWQISSGNASSLLSFQWHTWIWSPILRRNQFVHIFPLSNYKILDFVEWLMYLYIPNLKVHRNKFQMNRKKKQKENFSICFSLRIFETESIKWFLFFFFLFASFLCYLFSVQNRLSCNTFSWLEPRAQNPMRNVHRRPNRRIWCVKHKHTDNMFDDSWNEQFM